MDVLEQRQQILFLMCSFWDCTFWHCTFFTTIPSLKCLQSYCSNNCSMGCFHRFLVVRGSIWLRFSFSHVVASLQHEAFLISWQVCCFCVELHNNSWNQTGFVSNGPNKTKTMMCTLGTVFVVFVPTHPFNQTLCLPEHSFCFV